MTRPAFVAILALACQPAAPVLAFGCGYPDRRDADIVTSAELAPRVRFAVTWWAEATGDVGASLQSRCRDDSHCVYIGFGPIESAAYGQTSTLQRGTIFGGRTTSYVTLRAGVDLEPEAWAIIVAHELGHAMGLAHVGNAGELMAKQLDWERPCIGPQTLRMWRDEYGGGPYMGACRTLDDARLALEP